MKVHITFTKGILADPSAKKQALAVLTERLQLSNVNVARFERYGIVSGDVPGELVSAAKDFDFVESVAPDGIQRALDTTVRRKDIA